MSKEDIQLLNDNGLCVVEAKDPAKVRFVDPIPVQSSRTQIENSAIRLSRKMLGSGTCPYNEDTRKTFTQMFVDLLVEGTPLDPRPSQEEKERMAYDEAKIEELRKLAREDARAERKAKKAAETQSEAKD